MSYTPFKMKGFPKHETPLHNDEAARKKRLAEQIKKRKEEAGEGFMTPPYKGPEGKGPRANRKDLSHHGYKNFKSNVTGKKVHTDGVPEKLGNPAKSDAQKKVIAKKKEFDAMSNAEKAALQEKRNQRKRDFDKERAKKGK